MTAPIGQSTNSQLLLMNYKIIFKTLTMFVTHFLNVAPDNYTRRYLLVYSEHISSKELNNHTGDNGFSCCCCHFWSTHFNQYRGYKYTIDLLTLMN